ncbi:MAG: TonB-dependent receptor [Muribaculaceae bacterium]|nr:TonB-dependent receptor [Muribaculaceae bacterium]
MKLNFKIQLRNLFTFIIFLCISSLTFAQTQMVTGSVVDPENEPLPGATVMVKGSTRGVATDLEGNYSIAAKKGEVLVFSYVGMRTHEVKISHTTINVQLIEDIGNLDELVVVGYGVQKRGNITGAISTVNDKELLKSPTMSLSNVIGGRVSGVATVQQTGQPGYDNASITVRGQSNIVYVIDGVRRTSSDFNGIDPNEIESISVLKDASAVAVYGLDANAAFIITTKKGRSDKTQISYSGSVGFTQNALQQEWLTGPEFAKWYNKALSLTETSDKNAGTYNPEDGLYYFNPKFSDDQVQMMINGTNGWGNTDWYNEMYGNGFRTHHNISATGGNDRVHFFASVGYLKEDGNLDGYGYNRYNLRGNIDAKITNNLTFDLGISGRIEDRDATAFGTGKDDFLNVPQQIVSMYPFLPKTAVWSDGKEYTTGAQGWTPDNNAWGATHDTGYSKSRLSYISANMSLKYDAPFLKGLSAKFLASYDLYYSFSKTLHYPLKHLLADINKIDINTVDMPYNLVWAYQGYNNTQLNEAANTSSTLSTQTSINYDNTFGKHTINALALLETRQLKSNGLGAGGMGLDFLSLDELGKLTFVNGNGEIKQPTISGSSSESRVAGFVGRVNYNYDDKYFVEGTIRYDGSYLFGGMNKRWVALPGASLGWRISKEEFFNVDWINDFKLRVAVGETGISGISPFQWLTTMVLNKNAVIIGGTPSTFISAGGLGNPYLQWAKCLNYNAGFNILTFQGRLGLEFDVFYKHEYDLLTTATGAYPPSMGGYYFSTANGNEKDYRGVDITLTHNNSVGDFNYGVKVVYSYAYGRWLKYMADSENAPSYDRVTGTQIGARRGLIALGLFQSQEEIDNSILVDGYPVKVGYLKYLDRNGDGKIVRNGENSDVGIIAKSAIPTSTGAIDLFGSWKGIDIDMLWGWGLGHDVAMTGQYQGADNSGTMDHTMYTKPFYQGGNAPRYLVENSWTPENRTAYFPRLETTPYSQNNAISSSYWYKKGDYIRLKTAQIGYTFPQKLIGRSGITRLRVYAEGYNLLTFSGLNKFNIDPESPAVNNGYYPQQRSYSFGINISF